MVFEQIVRKIARMSVNLFGYVRDYGGFCDLCGADMKSDLLMVSDLEQTDEHGNRLFFILGVPDSMQTPMGKHFECPECGSVKYLLRLYENLDVTDEIKAMKAH